MESALCSVRRPWKAADEPEIPTACCKLQLRADPEITVLSSYGADALLPLLLADGKWLTPSWNRPGRCIAPESFQAWCLSFCSLLLLNVRQKSKA